MTGLVPGLDDGPSGGRAGALAEMGGATAVGPPVSLTIAGDGAAVEVDDGWAGLTGQEPGDALGSGWQAVLDPADRAALVDRMVQGRTAGQADGRVLTGHGARWMRFWWRAIEGAAVEVVVADVDDLVQRAARDPLTGLANRRELLDRIDEALRRGRGSGELPVVVYVDLDGFKQVNDAHGHHVGDGILAEVAGCIANAARPSDVAGRVGGDEFAVLCGGPCHPADAVVIAERIERSIEALGVGPAVGLSATAGAARGSRGDTAETLLGRADQAMYAARARRVRQRMVGATPTGIGSSPPGDQQDVVDLATSVVHRIFGVGLSLHAASRVADEETLVRLQAAVDELDEVVKDVRLVVFRPMEAVPAPAADVRAIDRLLGAIDAAARELHGEWVAAVDPRAAVGDGDRIARAAEHVRAAVRALDPDALG